MALKLDFGKLPWHTQLGAFATLAAAAVGVFWYFYASPQRTALDAKQAQLQTLQADIDRGLSTARRLPEFRKEVEQLTAQLERLRNVLPEEQNVADLLKKVQAMATESNLTIRGFSPAAVTKRELHAEWPIGLKLEGTYRDLGAFLERVSKFPRIINVSGIKIQARTDQTTSQTVTAECTATTFVLLEQAGAKPGAPAVPKAAQMAVPHTAPAAE